MTKQSVDFLSIKAPVPLRRFCIWLMFFGVVTVLCGILGRYTTSGGEYLDHSFVYRAGFDALIIGTGILFFFVSFHAMKGRVWTKQALYLLPFPSMMIGAYLEWAYDMFDISELYIIVYLVLWVISVRRLLLKQEVAQFFSRDFS